GDDAHGVQAKDAVQPPEGQPGADAHAQFDDLALGVVRGHAVPELLVEAVVVEDVPFGVLGGEAGAVVEGVGGAPFGDRVGEPVLDLPPVAFGAPVEAERAAVELGHAQARGLELAEAEGGVLVDGQGEVRGGGADAGDQLAPRVLDGVLAVGDVEVHGRVPPSLPTAGRTGTSPPAARWRCAAVASTVPSMRGSPSMMTRCAPSPSGGFGQSGAQDGWIRVTCSMTMRGSPWTMPCTSKRTAPCVPFSKSPM